jgi:cell division protein FtsB
MKVFHPIFSFVTLLLFIYVCSLGIKNIIRYNGHNLQYEQSLADLKKETRLNRSYKNTLSAMKENAFWELKARQDLGYAKPGEVVYRITAP